MSTGFHTCLLKTVSGNHLSSEKPTADPVMQMANALCLPSRHEHHLQRENYITLTERAVVEIPCLSFFKPVVCKHIPHQYSKEMAEKSEMVLHITLSKKSLLCNSRKYPYSLHRRDWKFQGGRGLKDPQI